MRSTVQAALAVSVAAVIGTAGSLAVAQETLTAGLHWPGKGLFGKGVLHTGTAPRFTVYAQQRDQAGNIEVHDQDTDIILFMDGSATFVTGGTLIGRRQLRPDEWT